MECDRIKIYNSLRKELPVRKQVDFKPVFSLEQLLVDPDNSIDITDKFSFMDIDTDVTK